MLARPTFSKDTPRVSNLPRVVSHLPRLVAPYGKMSRLLRARCLRTLVGAGTVGLAFGLFAVVSGDSLPAYFPLVLVSASALAVSALTLPGVRKRYKELELRRIQAMNA